MSVLAVQPVTQAVGGRRWVEIQSLDVGRGGKPGMGIDAITLMIRSGKQKVISRSVLLLTVLWFVFSLTTHKSMMSLSQTTGYAIKALACIHGLGSEACYIRDVAECTGVPKAYLARVISRLSHKGIITSKRGYRGGITLARAADRIALLEIVEAVEGEHWIGPCLLGLDGCCSGMLCPTTEFWRMIRDQIETKLRTTTLADMLDPAHQFHRGQTSDSRDSVGGGGPMLEIRGSSQSLPSCRNTVCNAQRT